MKKFILILGTTLITLSSSFATYTISVKDKQKVDNFMPILYKQVNNKFKTEKKRNYILQSIVDTIDGYIVLHKNKLTQRQIVILLLIKTYILKHLWYKIWNPIKLIIK